MDSCKTKHILEQRSDNGLCSGPFKIPTALLGCLFENIPINTVQIRMLDWILLRKKIIKFKLIIINVWYSYITHTCIWGEGETHHYLLYHENYKCNRSRVGLSKTSNFCFDDVWFVGIEEDITIIHKLMSYINGGDASKPTRPKPKIRSTLGIYTYVVDFHPELNVLLALYTLLLTIKMYDLFHVVESKIHARVLSTLAKLWVLGQ